MQNFLNSIKISINLKNVIDDLTPDRRFFGFQSKWKICKQYEMNHFPCDTISSHFKILPNFLTSHLSN